ncbi:MAG TPA: SPFH domain-containing protein [Solirubrobacteraceae bacterium]|jgi:membrane protease subunit (stomatin/prohibitin family)|nr:SPFH domain-containing protein [Solirubrobacteraceae bacterium]
MPLFDGHSDKGLERLFIEMPDSAKGKIAWKWPDQQIVQHSQLNVDLDYQAVFTNLGKVIGVLGPGRHTLDEGASLLLGWLVDSLTGNAYYDAEVYFLATRDIPNIEFGGPVDNLTDSPTGLVVSVRVFGELAFRVSDPTLLLAKLIGTGANGDYDAQISSWIKDQTLAAVRAVLPDLVATHGVLAMGQLQDPTAAAALNKANASLSPYGLALTTFGELNVNLPDTDAQQLKQLAATKAYVSMAGSFDSAVRGEAALEIAQGVAAGNVGAQPGIMAGMMMGVPVAPAAPAIASAAPAPGARAGGSAVLPVQGETTGSGGPAPGATAHAHFCSQCGTAVLPGSRYCLNCGAALTFPEQ